MVHRVKVHRKHRGRAAHHVAQGVPDQSSGFGGIVRLAVGSSKVILPIENIMGCRGDPVQVAPANLGCVALRHPLVLSRCPLRPSSAVAQTIGSCLFEKFMFKIVQIKELSEFIMSKSARAIMEETLVINDMAVCGGG